MNQFLNIFEGTEASLNLYIGIHIVKKSVALDLSQKAYLIHMLKQYHMAECQIYSTPIVSNFFDEFKFDEKYQVSNATN